MKPWWREIFRCWTEQGSAMIAALFALLILLFVGATAFNLGHLEGIIAWRHVQYLQASYLAESGIEKARAMIFDDPLLLNNPGTNYRLAIDEPELQGEALVTVIQPSLNGLLTIKSEARLTGARKIWQATMTAPPLYDLYCREVRVNPILDVVGLLQTFGIEHHDPVLDLEGELQVEQNCQGAYQQFVGDAEYFSEFNHTHRYQPPGVEMSFWQETNITDAIDWKFYSYRFFDNSIRLSSTLGSGIYAVNGDVLIYSDEGSIDLEGCLVIAKGDIWIVNLSQEPSEISGLYLAGRDVNLYQETNDMKVRANLCAGRNINLCCGGKENHIYFTHAKDQEFIRRAPRILWGKLGFMSIKSYQEVVN